MDYNLSINASNQSKLFKSEEQDAENKQQQTKNLIETNKTKEYVAFSGETIKTFNIKD